MLDRYGRLNNLLNNVIGNFPKQAAEEDDIDIDLGPLYKAPAKAIPTPIPPPQVIHVAPAKPIAPAPVPAASPAPEELPKEPINPDLPSWWDKGWKPIPKFKLPEDRFPTSHWRKLEDDSPKASQETPAPAKEIEVPSKQELPIEKPETIEEELGLQPSTVSISDAKEYLETLPQTDLLNEAITALGQADSELQTNAGNKKLTATILAYIIAHLMGLINHADEAFKAEKDRAIAATKVLIDHFQKEVAKLPKTYQETANNKIQQAIHGRKKGPIRELKSQFYGPELIFVNNRAIQIMRLLNISIDEAEKQAQDEWSSISELIEKILPNSDYTDREELKRIGANKILGGGTFEEAKNEVEINAKAISSGIISAKDISMDKSQLDKLFPGVRYEAGSNWEEDIAQDMSDEEFVKGQLEELPNEISDKLAQKITRFAELALKFSKVKALKTSFDNKGDVEQATEADTALQRIFHKFENIASEIFRINPTYLENKLAHEQLQDVYVIYKNVTTTAKEDGLESINSVPISSAQSASEGLYADPSAPGTKEPSDSRFRKVNPRLRRIDETEEQYALRQKHEKELADASRHRYLKNILQSGEAQGYLKRKLQYRLSQRPKETNEEYKKRIKIENEKDRIRDPEYKKNSLELTKWNYLATIKIDKSALSKEIRKLLESQQERTNDIYDRINESWLPAEDVAEIPNLLMNTRIENFQSAYNTLKGRSTTNPLVLKALEYVVQKIPEYFEIAKEKAHDEKVSSANITLDMASSFQKYSKLRGSSTES